MSEKVVPADLGEPDLKVAGFQLWVHGRERPDSEDDDGNWLRVTAHCGALGASVWAEGAILQVTDIVRFGEQCAAMLNRDGTSAALDPYEPELRAVLETTDALGHIHAQVDITPDHLSQAHRFKFEVDQSFLPAIVQQCSRIAHEFPIRGA